ncbi:putative RNA-directed DNA polymerase [Tanacetum coccineum]
MTIGNPSGSAVTVNGLDASNLLIWFGAIKLALQARNKYGFVDGTCLKESYATNDVLSTQWDRCNAMVLSWIMNVVSQDVYMGLVYSDNAATSVRSSLLIRDPLPEVKDAYNVFYREESHRGILESSSVTESKQNATSFVAKNFNNNRRQFNNNNFTRGFASNVNREPNSNLSCKYYGKIGHTIDRCFDPQGFKRNSNTDKQTFNANSDVKMNDKSSSSLSSGFTYEQMQKLLSMINDKLYQSIHANMAGRASFFNSNVWFNIKVSRYFYASSSFSVTSITMGQIIDSGANCDNRMYNIVDISELKITVGHPNGTLATISHVRNLKLTNNVILYDVLIESWDLKREKVLGTGSESGGLYLFDMNNSNCIGKSYVVMSFHVSKLLWHNRLGHHADQVLSVLINDLSISDNTSVTMCEVYQRAKQIRDHFPLSDHKSKTVGELVHLDLWGPYRVQCREGYRYFLTIVDDYSKAVWVYLVKAKDEVFDMFVSYIKMIHNQFDVKIKTIRSDNGTKFVNKKMFNMFSDLARSLMFEGGIPLRFWSDCVLTALYLLNRLPSSVLNGKSPFELVYKRKPNLSYFWSFGCLCFSTVLNNHDKMSFRSEKCVLVGYSTNKKAYNLLSLDSRNVFYSRDVKFYEKIYPFKQKTYDSKMWKKTSKVDHLQFFDGQFLKSPYDDGKDSLVEDGSLPHSVNTDSTQGRSQNSRHSATQVDDQNWSEGNTQNSIPSPI